MGCRLAVTKVVFGLVALAHLLPSAANAENSSLSSLLRRSTVRESFRFDPDAGFVLVPVRIGNKDHLFVLDTGANLTACDVSLRSHLGPRVSINRITTPRGSVESGFHALPDARLGSLDLNLLDPVGCVDCGPIREASGYDVRGFLGLDFLKKWIVTLDSDLGRVDFLDPSSIPHEEWGERVPFLFGEGGMMWAVPTAGEETQNAFVIDTGFNGTGSLDEATASELAAFNGFRTTGTTESMDLSGAHVAKVGRLSRLSVGSLVHKNLRFTLGTTRNSLGLGYLRRYRITFDFPAGQLYLIRGKRFADPDRGTMCGLSVLFKPNGVIVESVDKNGPAYSAGVRPKDAVQAISGKPVAKMTPAEMRRVFTSDKGEVVRLTLEREGKRIEVSFVPKEYD
ncbi:MAG: aspartyl protease family protein [Pirellulales bacterium]